MIGLQEKSKNFFFRIFDFYIDLINRHKQSDDLHIHIFIYNISHNFEKIIKALSWHKIKNL